MFGFIIALHIIVSILLAAIILMQSGRGGGLTESFSSAESMFGAQTSEFLVKGTSVLSVCFLVTCLTIAVMSSKKSESIMTSDAASVVTDVADKSAQ